MTCAKIRSPATVKKNMPQAVCGWGNRGSASPSNVPAKMNTMMRIHIARAINFMNAILSYQKEIV